MGLPVRKKLLFFVALSFLILDDGVNCSSLEAFMVHLIWCRCIHFFGTSDVTHLLVCFQVEQALAGFEVNLKNVKNDVQHRNEGF